jgi:hypothetical protein
MATAIRRIAESQIDEVQVEIFHFPFFDLRLGDWRIGGLGDFVIVN